MVKIKIGDNLVLFRVGQDKPYLYSVNNSIWKYPELIPTNAVIHSYNHNFTGMYDFMASPFCELSDRWYRSDNQTCSQTTFGNCNSIIYKDFFSGSIWDRVKSSIIRTNQTFTEYNARYETFDAVSSGVFYRGPIYATKNAYIMVGLYTNGDGYVETYDRVSKRILKWPKIWDLSCNGYQSYFLNSELTTTTNYLLWYGTATVSAQSYQYIGHEYHLWVIVDENGNPRGITRIYYDQINDNRTETENTYGLDWGTGSTTANNIGYGIIETDRYIYIYGSFLVKLGAFGGLSIIDKQTEKVYVVRFPIDSEYFNHVRAVAGTGNGVTCTRLFYDANTNTLYARNVYRYGNQLTTDYHVIKPVYDETNDVFTVQFEIGEEIYKLLDINLSESYALAANKSGTLFYGHASAYSLFFLRNDFNTGKIEVQHIEAFDYVPYAISRIDDETFIVNCHAVCDWPDTYKCYLLKPGLAHTLDIHFPNVTYTYDGNPIDTYVKVAAKDYEGNYVSAKIKLTVQTGDGAFIDSNGNEVLEYIVTTDSNGPIQVPFRILGPGKVTVHGDYILDNT